MSGMLLMVTLPAVSKTALMICKASFLAPWGIISPCNFFPPITSNDRMHDYLPCPPEQVGSYLYLFLLLLNLPPPLLRLPSLRLRSAARCCRTAPGLEQLYAGTDRAELVRQITSAKGFEGAALRYGDFFDALQGRFDGTWSNDQADLAVLSLPVLAAREDASAAFRLLLEDLGHYGVARKDRDDQGMTVYLEEFSAVSTAPARQSTWPSGSGTPGSGWCSSSSPTRASATSTRPPGCWAAAPR